MVEICSCQYCTFNRVFDPKHELNFAWQASKVKGWGQGKTEGHSRFRFFSLPSHFFCPFFSQARVNLFIFPVCVDTHFPRFQY